VRNSSGEILPGQNVAFRISILAGSEWGATVYAEEHNAVTNDFGLVNLKIGAGNILTGSFSPDGWGLDTHFIKVEMDVTGGAGYVLLGTSQLLSVPYAFHAQTVEEDNTEDADADPANEIQILSINNDTLYLSNGGYIPNIVSYSGVAESDNFLSFDGTNWITRELLLTTENTGNGSAIDIMQPFLTLNFIIALQGIFPSRNVAEPFLATIIMFGGNFAPRGWAFCDGQLLAVASNQALFSLLGTTYGGDGRTTFGLPDLRGRVPLHEGTGSGLTPRSLGSKGGAETHIITVPQLPAHKHNVIIQQ